MNRHRILAAAAGALLTATVLAGAPTANAGGPPVGHADVEITYNDYAFTVCVAGRVDSTATAVGGWLLEINGRRSDGTSIHESVSGSGATFRPPCEGIPNYEAPNGAFVVTLSFVRANPNNLNPIPDITAVAGGEGSWNPITVNTFGT